jgi:hypothetical protein
MSLGNKEVDVIYTLYEDNTVTILEVIETDDIQVSLDRKKFYEKIYDKVGLYCGVDVYRCI